MKINEQLVKISAVATPLAGEIEIGKEVTVVVKGTVTKSEDRDNQDGTFDRIFTVKGEVSGVTVEGEGV